MNSLQEALDAYRKSVEQIKEYMLPEVIAAFDDEQNQFEFYLTGNIQQLLIQIESKFSKETGLYYFEADFRDFYKLWRKANPQDHYKPNTEYRRQFYDHLNRIWKDSRGGTIPSLISTRFNIHNRLKAPACNKYCNDEFVPFYLGKAQDIFERVNEHIETKNGSKKYSCLRLHEMKNNFKSIKFRLSIAALPILRNEDMYGLVYNLESGVREMLSPIFGRK